MEGRRGRFLDRCVVDGEGEDLRRGPLDGPERRWPKLWVPACFNVAVSKISIELSSGALS
jgi:hypothetical protein